MLLGDHESEPAELGELLPVGRVLAARRIRQAPHARDREALFEPAARLGAQQSVLLFVVDRYVHRVFGSPSTRSPNMFRRISLVPPAIVIANEFM